MTKKEKINQKVIKKGGIMSIMHAFSDSLWQEVTEFVNAFLMLYRAEVI